MEPWQLGVIELVDAIQSRRLLPADVVRSVCARIAALDNDLQAWVTVLPGEALSAAERLAKQLGRGVDIGPLGGVPVGIKDIYYTDGVRTTASSRVLADFVPKTDATAVARLRRNGAVITGKLHTAEFAATDPAPTRNAWDLERTPGGSSSGSAAAVAAGMVPAALGSQTGGSTLRPAAFNGIVGVKPSYGTVSTRGMIPLAWSFDHVGVLARSVSDAALVLATIADRGAPVQSRRHVRSGFPASGTPIRIGVPRGLFEGECASDVAHNFETTVEQLAADGALVSDVAVAPSLRRIKPTYGVMLRTEMATYHRQQFAASPEDYGPNIAVLIREGLRIRGVDYVDSARERASILSHIAAMLADVDVLLMPTVGTVAPKGLADTGDASLQIPWSYAGLPAVSLPSALNGDGVPFGVQLVGKFKCDGNLLAIARWCEHVLGFRAHPWSWSRSRRDIPDQSDGAKHGDIREGVTYDG